MSPATTEVARSAQGVRGQLTRGQLTNPFIPHWRGNLNAIRLASLVSFGAIFGFTFVTLVLSKVQKHQLTDFTEKKYLIYY